MTAERTISYPVWWKSPNGGMVRRDALEPDHPGSVYQYLLSIGEVPEHFGVTRHRAYGEALE